MSTTERKRAIRPKTYHPIWRSLKQYGITQQALAQAAKMSKTSLCMLLIGQRPMRPSIEIVLLHHLDHLVAERASQATPPEPAEAG